MAIATFAAGCFWGVEAKFRQLDGVLSTRVGYSNGHTLDPTYPDVCTGTTGHAEVIEITFDSDIISYSELINAFWALHDPTTLNRQGPDRGTQYRSAIFYHDDVQRQTAIDSRTIHQQQLSHPIATEITAADNFYPAEAYHQCYLEKKGLGSCH